MNFPYFISRLCTIFCDKLSQSGIQIILSLNSMQNTNWHFLSFKNMPWQIFTFYELFYNSKIFFCIFFVRDFFKSKCEHLFPHFLTLLSNVWLGQNFSLQYQYNIKTISSRQVTRIKIISIRGLLVDPIPNLPN